MMITKLSATVLFVKDLETSVQFYRDILGLPVHEVLDGFAAFALPGQALALMTVPYAADLIGDATIPQTGAGPARGFLAVFLDDVDEAYATFTARGVAFLAPPKTQPWGQRIAYFRDPDGHLWELSHFLPDPAPGATPAG